MYVHVSLRNVYIDRKRESPVCISGKELSSIHLSFRSFSCRKPPSLSLAYNDCFLSQVSNASKRTVFGFALSRTHRACTWGLAPASAYFFRARSAKNRCRNTLALPSTCSNFFLLVFSSLLFLALIPCCRDVVTRFPFTLFFCFLSLPRCRFLDGRAFPATPVFLLAHFFFSFPLRVSLGLTPIWSLATSEGVKTIIIKKKTRKKESSFSGRLTTPYLECAGV